MGTIVCYATTLVLYCFTNAVTHTCTHEVQMEHKAYKAQKTTVFKVPKGLSKHPTNCGQMLVQ